MTVWLHEQTEKRLLMPRGSRVWITEDVLFARFPKRSRVHY